MTFDSGTTIYALDPDSYQVLGSTNPWMWIKPSSSWASIPSGCWAAPRDSRPRWMGRPATIVFSSMGSFILGRVTTDAALYESMNRQQSAAGGIPGAHRYHYDRVDLGVSGRLYH